MQHDDNASSMRRAATKATAEGCHHTRLNVSNITKSDRETHTHQYIIYSNKLALYTKMHAQMLTLTTNITQLKPVVAAAYAA